MTFPLWMLLGFTLWTAAVLVFAIGLYRFSLIFTGRAGMWDPLESTCRHASLSIL